MTATVGPLPQTAQKVPSGANTDSKWFQVDAKKVQKTTDSKVIQVNAPISIYTPAVIGESVGMDYRQRVIRNGKETQAQHRGRPRTGKAQEEGTQESPQARWRRKGREAQARSGRGTGDLRLSGLQHNEDREGQRGPPGSPGQAGEDRVQVHVVEDRIEGSHQHRQSRVAPHKGHDLHHQAEGREEGRHHSGQELHNEAEGLKRPTVTGSKDPVFLFFSFLGISVSHHGRLPSENFSRFDSCVAQWC
jgi:hypothetical protein